MLSRGPLGNVRWMSVMYSPHSFQEILAAIVERWSVVERYRAVHRNGRILNCRNVCGVLILVEEGSNHVSEEDVGDDASRDRSA